MFTFADLKYYIAKFVSERTNRFDKYEFEVDEEMGPILMYTVFGEVLYAWTENMSHIPDYDTAAAVRAFYEYVNLKQMLADERSYVERLFEGWAADKQVIADMERWLDRDAEADSRYQRVIIKVNKHGGLYAMCGYKKVTQGWRNERITTDNLWRYEDFITDDMALAVEALREERDRLYEGDLPF